MNDFDKAARFAAKLNPAAFFRWLMPRLALWLVFRGWLDTRRLPFPGEGDRICDTVADFEDTKVANRRWAIVVEFSSEAEHLMLHRLGDYEGRLNLELQTAPETRGRYLVAGALLNLTGPEHPDTLDARLPGMRGYGRRERVVLRTLRTQSAAGTLRRIAAGQLDRCILPWIPLMRGGGDPRIIRWWRRLAEGEPDERLRRQYAGLALFFANLAGHQPAWQQALEGLNVRRSAVADEWRADARREDIRRVLEVRLKIQVPADLVAAIDALTGLNEVTRWFEASLTADSLDAFRTAVGR